MQYSEIIFELRPPWSEVIVSNLSKRSSYGCFMQNVSDEVLETIEQILFSPFHHSMDIQLQSDLTGTDETRVSVMPAGEGVSEVSKSNCQFLYPQTV